MPETRSHFYVVEGTPRGEVLPTMRWLFHSYKTKEEFTSYVAEICEEYNISVQEESLVDMYIIRHWEIK